MLIYFIDRKFPFNFWHGWWDCVTENKMAVSAHNLKILNSLLRIISRTILLTTIRLYLWIDLNETKVPITFGHDQKVVGACVAENRKSVSTDYLKVRLTYNSKTLNVDRGYPEKVPIDFGCGGKVGWACVPLNRKTVSAYYLEIHFTYNSDTLNVDRAYREEGPY